MGACSGLHASIGDGLADVAGGGHLRMGEPAARHRSSSESSAPSTRCSMYSNPGSTPPAANVSVGPSSSANALRTSSSPASVSSCSSVRSAMAWSWVMTTSRFKACRLPATSGHVWASVAGVSWLVVVVGGGDALEVGRCGGVVLVAAFAGVGTAASGRDQRQCGGREPVTEPVPHTRAWPAVRRGVPARAGCWGGEGDWHRLLRRLGCGLGREQLLHATAEVAASDGTAPRGTQAGRGRLGTQVRVPLQRMARSPPRSTRPARSSRPPPAGPAAPSPGPCPRRREPVEAVAPSRPRPGTVRTPRTPARSKTGPRSAARTRQRRRTRMRLRTATRPAARDDACGAR